MKLRQTSESQVGAILLPRGYLAMADIFGCHIWEVGGHYATGIWWVEAKDSAESLGCTGQPPAPRINGPKMFILPRLRKPEKDIKIRH